MCACMALEAPSRSCKQFSSRLLTLCVHVYTHIHMCACMQDLQVRHKYMHVYVHILMRVCMYPSLMYSHTYIHTYIHTGRTHPSSSPSDMECCTAERRQGALWQGLSACLSVCTPICLSVCLSVCLSLVHVKDAKEPYLTHTHTHAHTYTHIKHTGCGHGQAPGL